MFSVYILRGPKNHLYVGCTSNISQRIDRHKSGQGAEFTFRNKTNELVYREDFPTLLEATEIESVAATFSRARAVRARETAAKLWRNSAVSRR